MGFAGEIRVRTVGEIQLCVGVKTSCVKIPAEEIERGCFHSGGGRFENKHPGDREKAVQATAGRGLTERTLLGLQEGIALPVSEDESVDNNTRFGDHPRKIQNRQEFLTFSLLFDNMEFGKSRQVPDCLGHIEHR